MSFSYVVFERVKHRWWNYFLSRDINHCYIVEPYADKFIALNKTTHSLEVFLIDDFSVILSECKVIKAHKVKAKQSLLNLNTCVTLTKNYLGVKKPFIFTPYQLYKHLRKT